MLLSSSYVVNLMISHIIIQNYAIWLIFECARAKTFRKSWDLIHKSYWVTPQIYTLRTSPRMEITLVLILEELLMKNHEWYGRKCIFLLILTYSCALFLFQRWLRPLNVDLFRIFVSFSDRLICQNERYFNGILLP